ncbi:MAG: hypothetical protein RLY93_08325 [Sumerlaeia bacterium]
MGCKRKILIAGFLLFAGSCFLIIGLHLSLTRYRYYTESDEERRVLIEELTQQREGHLEFSQRPGMSSAFNDPDLRWPYDRMGLVIAINQFALEMDRLPHSIQELGDSGFLEPRDYISYRYTLDESGKWRITRHDYEVAKGN